MDICFLFALEISRTGKFYVQPNFYDILNITSNIAPLVAFGRLACGDREASASIPVYENDTMTRQLGFIRIIPSQLYFNCTDLFTFNIDKQHSITFRMVNTTQFPGAINSATPIPLPKFAVIGHRGSGAQDFTIRCLENSIISYTSAFSAGADGVEIDVQLTKDGIAVVNHNLVVESPENCVGQVQVKQITAADFKKSGLCTDFEIERVTLREVFEGIPKKGVFDIHLKYLASQDGPYQDRNQYTERVIREIEEHGDGRHFFFCTFDLLLAVTMSLRQRKYPVLLLANQKEWLNLAPLFRWLRELILALKWAGIPGLVLYSPNVIAAPRFVQECLRNQLQVIVWGPDTLSQYGIDTQLRLGVTGFVTDDVAMTVALVAKSRTRRRR
jgi:glycerophosphoryl diester phosphodiesterase